MLFIKLESASFWEEMGKNKSELQQLMEFAEISTRPILNLFMEDMEINPLKKLKFNIVKNSNPIYASLMIIWVNDNSLLEKSPGLTL